MEQASSGSPGTLAVMAKHLQRAHFGLPQILKAEKDGDDGLLVAFSDETIGAYVVEELLDLRPNRERVRKPIARNPGQEAATLL